MQPSPHASACSANSFREGLDTTLRMQGRGLRGRLHFGPTAACTRGAQSQQATTTQHCRAQGIKRGRAQDDESCNLLDLHNSSPLVLGTMLVDIGMLAESAPRLVLDFSSSVWARRRCKRMKTSHAQLERAMSNVSLSSTSVCAHSDASERADNCWDLLSMEVVWPPSPA